MTALQTRAPEPELLAPETTGFVVRSEAGAVRVQIGNYLDILIPRAGALALADALEQVAGSGFHRAPPRETKR